MKPLTLSIVQFIFYVWSFEISRNMFEKSENTIGLDSYILIQIPFGFKTVTGLTAVLKLEITIFFVGFHCQIIQGHLRELIIRNRSVCPTLFPLNVSTALKGTHYILLFIYCSLVIIADAANELTSQNQQPNDAVFPDIFSLMFFS